MAVVLAASLAPVAAVAQQLPSAYELQAGLAGKWAGALGYRDYQSDKLFELPVTTEIRVLPDKATVIRVSSFDDGPKTGFVYITSAGLYDLASSTVTTASLRKSRPVETITEKTTVLSFRDTMNWSVRYERSGTDGGKAAQIRLTETRASDTVVAVKEVLMTDEPRKGWQFRNQTRLVRSR